MNTVSSLRSNLNVKKRRWLVLFQHSCVNDFHHILHLKVHLWLILCWTGTNTVKTRTGCQEPQQPAPPWRAWTSASAAASEAHLRFHEITSKTLGKLSSTVNRSKPGLKEAQNTLKKFLNCNLGMGGCGGAAKTSAKVQGGYYMKTVQKRLY